MTSSQPRAANSRRQTFLNLEVLHKAQPMLPKVAQAIFEKNGLDKLTQNLFNNISYYLLFVIEPQFHSSMTWPLYDTKAERAFRSELSRFISDYAAKGLLSDVRSSYLVHPSCYKVTILIHQLSVLAIKQWLVPRIKGTEKHKIFEEVEEKYKNKSDHKSFIEYMKSLNYENSILDKMSKFMYKKQCCEKIAQMLRKKIVENETKLASLNAQGYIDGLVNGFVEKNELDELMKNEFLKIKNIRKSAPIFDEWLKDLDVELDDMEGKWDSKVLALLEKSRKLYSMSEELIKREMGQIDRNTYIIEYDPKKDAINTDKLQSQVNSSQKYILKNIEQDGKLNFPNLIQAFVISICYIMKNVKFGEKVYEHNKRMKVCQAGFSEVREALKALLERVDTGERRIQLTHNVRVRSRPLEEHLQIPPIPDLSGLKMCHNQYQANFDTFTPLNMSRHKFNLRRRGEVFARPQPRPVTTYHATKDDFLKTLLSCKVGAYDRGNTSQSSNISVISSIKANETVCSSGFTREQVARLLSTKKKSSNKKHKKATESHDKIKKCALFNESVVAKDTHGLFRSYSSPDLLENRERRPILSNIRGRKLSIMQEDSPQQLDVSGIACLDSNFNTPSGFDTLTLDTLTSANINDFPKKFEDKNCLNNIQREMKNIAPPIPEQESRVKIVTASKIPRIITTETRKEQEMHFPNTEKARELLESRLTKIITATELPRISISPITDQETHPSTARNSQETHSSEILIGREIPIISFSPVNIQEPSSAQMVTVRHLQESHSSKTGIISISPITDQESHPSTARNSQETHSSEVLIGREIPIISFSPVSIQEPSSSQMVTVRHLQESHSSKTGIPRMSFSPINSQESLSKTVTPKPNTALIKKTSSLEKIINRFKQVRANVIPLREENENFHTNDALTNRNLLPDLLSPGCSFNRRSNSDNNVDLLDSDTEDIVRRGPRVSLGTMLGVDHTFLDQFDLSD